jgi:hypothetical protein
MFFVEHWKVFHQRWKKHNTRLKNLWKDPCNILCKVIKVNKELTGRFEEIHNLVHEMFGMVKHKTISNLGQ